MQETEQVQEFLPLTSFKNYVYIGLLVIFHILMICLQHVRCFFSKLLMVLRVKVYDSAHGPELFFFVCLF